MSYEIYRLGHLLGVFWLLTALGGLSLRQIGGGAPESDPSTRRLALVDHGFGALLILVSGFGMLAKQGIGAPPGWALAKVGLWVLLGAVPFVLRLLPGRRAIVIWAGVPIIALLAAYLGLTKPMG